MVPAHPGNDPLGGGIVVGDGGALSDVGHGHGVGAIQEEDVVPDRGAGAGDFNCVVKAELTHKIG